MQSVTIIGVGRVGGSFALALPRDKYIIDCLVVRDRRHWAPASDLSEYSAVVIEFSELEKVGSDTLIITTQDNEIENVSGAIAGFVDPATCVFHTSGSLSSSVLEPLRSRGCPVGSIHPLVSLSDPRLGAELLRGSYFCLEGDTAATERARSIVKDLGGYSFAIDTDKKALYHAAAVLASGHFVALLSQSIELMAKCGVDRETAKKILMPLVESTLSNLRHQTLADALTGTFARTDAAAFDRHLAALSQDGDARAVDTYLTLGDISLDLALERGGEPSEIDRMRKKISMAKTDLEC